MRWPMLLLTLLATAPARAGGVEIALSFTQTSVVASGMTAGGSLVWFSVAREPGTWTSVVVRRVEVAVDEDQDGEVEFALAEPPAPKGVWVALDLASGASAMAAPPEGAVILVPPDPGLIVEGEGEAGDALAPARHAAEILWARPGASGSAWKRSASEGGEADDDGLADGKLLASLSSFEPLGSGPPPPAELAPGDRIFVIDPDTLEAFGVEVPGEEVPAP